MSAIDLNIPHKLSKDEALSRIKNLLNKMKEEQKNVVTDLKEDWQDNKGSFSFNAKGFNLAGDIVVNDDAVQIHSELPFAVSFFKGAISDMISKKANEILV